MRYFDLMMPLCFYWDVSNIDSDCALKLEDGGSWVVYALYIELNHDS